MVNIPVLILYLWWWRINLGRLNIPDFIDRDPENLSFFNTIYSRWILPGKLIDSYTVGPGNGIRRLSFFYYMYVIGSSRNYNLIT